jgi:hypothetical protein
MAMVSPGTLATAALSARTPGALAVRAHALEDGAILWERAFPAQSGIYRNGLDPPRAQLARDTAGDVLVTGFADSFFTATKLRGADGTDVWTVGTVTPPGVFYGQSIVVDGAGDAILAGTAARPGGGRFSVMKLEGELPVPDVCGTAACRAPTAARAATLDLRNRRRDRRDTLAWTWGHGARPAADFGDPRTTSGFTLCVAAGAERLFDAVIPSGTACTANLGCWKKTRAGFRYRRKAGMSGAIERMVLKSGADGRPRIRIRARAGGLRLPTLPLTGTPRVVLRRTDGSTLCWAAEHPRTVRNREDRLIAVGP